MSDTPNSLLERLDEIEDKLAEQRLWNERVAGQDGKNGRVGSILSSARVALALATVAFGGAGGAVYEAIKESGHKDAEFERLKADTAKAQSELDAFKAFALRVLFKPPTEDLP